MDKELIEDTSKLLQVAKQIGGTYSDDGPEPTLRLPSGRPLRFIRGYRNRTVWLDSVWPDNQPTPGRWRLVELDLLLSVEELTAVVQKYVGESAAHYNEALLAYHERLERASRVASSKQVLVDAGCKPWIASDRPGRVETPDGDGYIEVNADETCDLVLWHLPIEKAVALLRALQ
jgi:hypothetical protein